MIWWTIYGPPYVNKQTKRTIKSYGSAAIIDPAIVLSMFILSFLFVIVRGWDPINHFSPSTCLCLSLSRTWISNVICLDLFLCSVNRGGVMIIHFADIGGIVDHHC